MSAPIKVLIRADASAALGSGHFARASAVAEALSANYRAEITLAFDAAGAALVPAMFPPGIGLASLGPGDTLPEAAAGGGWMPDVIYLDQYGAVPEWEALAADHGIPLLVIDDLDAARLADVIVRPHGGAARGPGAVVLTGPAYVPLSPRIVAIAGRERKPRAGRPKLNVCFGGSDPTGETAKAIEAAASLTGIDVDLVIGPGAAIAPPSGVADKPHMTFHHAPSQEKLAELLASADLALGAGGVMLWERLCLGIPSLVIAAAQNQRAQIDSMAAAGAIRFLGDHEDVTPAMIADAVSALAADEAARGALARIGPELVDGRGTLRLAAWIRALALDTRGVRPDDARDLLDWRTDERNWQHNFTASEKPDLAAHVAWLAQKLDDPRCIFRLVTQGSEPAGVVRFDLDEAGGSAYLSIYLVPAWHGRRMGLPVYCAAERALRRSHPAVNRIVSRIHRANQASQRLHRDAGFTIEASSAQPDWCDAWKLLD